MRAIIMAHIEEKDNPGGKKVSKINVLLETVLITFLASLLPQLTGGVPQSLADVWNPLISALIMSLYSYMRMRGIVLDE